MRVLRLIRGVTRWDRVRNVQIREDLNVTALLDEIERRKLQWYGHVMRMEEGRCPKKYLDWRPQGKRPVGRPRKRWIEGVEKAVRRRGSTMEEMRNSQLYYDRDRWRHFTLVLPTDR